MIGIKLRGLIKYGSEWPMGYELAVLQRYWYEHMVRSIGGYDTPVNGRT